MDSAIEGVIKKFNADEPLRLLCEGGIHFEVSNNQTLNRIVFHDSDDGDTLTRSYLGTRTVNVFLFMIYAKSFADLRSITQRMWAVFDQQTLELDSNEGAGHGHFLDGARHYVQDNPKRSEAESKRVWVGEMYYQSPTNSKTLTS